MKIQNLQNQKGFTLVEIAIVLVIIGLLLGGVLKGQELIQNSKVKSVVSEFNNIEAAYWAYRDRTGSYPTNTTTGFWFDLRTEGFITGDLATSTTAAGPEHALNGTFHFVPANTSNLIPSKGMLCATAIEDNIASNIDTKIDDSVGNTGNLRGVLETTAGTLNAAVPATVYSTSAASFTICQELQ